MLIISFNISTFSFAFPEIAKHGSRHVFKVGSIRSFFVMVIFNCLLLLWSVLEAALCDGVFNCLLLLRSVLIAAIPESSSSKRHGKENSMALLIAMYLHLLHIIHCLSRSLIYA